MNRQMLLETLPSLVVGNRSICNDLFALLDTDLDHNPAKDIPPKNGYSSDWGSELESESMHWEQSVQYTLADLRGRYECIPPSESNFLHFHAIFGKTLAR